jgi:hypothetical protein
MYAPTVVNVNFLNNSILLLHEMKFYENSICRKKKKLTEMKKKVAKRKNKKMKKPKRKIIRK